MKVLILTTYEENAKGGEARVPWELAEVLAKKCDTAILFPGDEYKIGERKEGLLRLHYAGEVMEDVWAVPTLNPKNLKNLFQILDKFNPDIIHIHDVGLLSLFVQIWALRNDAELFFTSHLLPTKCLEFGSLANLSDFIQEFLDFSLKPYLKMVFNNSDVVVALNEYAKRDIQKFGYKGNIEIIPNGKNLARFAKSKVPNIELREKVLTFIGWISERKNQKFLIQVMANLPSNYKLRLIGDVMSKDYKTELDRFIKKHHLKDRVEFTGQVPYEEIPRYLSETHYLVSASVMEVQSLVVIEALASGTPVIGLGNETINELVDDHVGKRLNEMTSPKKFAESVERNCEITQEQYLKISENARARVEHMDWDVVTDKTIEAYIKQRNEERKNNRDKKLRNTLKKMSKFKIKLPKQFQRQKKEDRVPSKVYVIGGVIIFVSTVIVVVLKFSKTSFRKIIDKLKLKRK